MLHAEIDPASPVPLYHQIAELIRARMQRAELRPGDALEPMRQAAEQWGVHLHTVRHAYAALAREGLLEMRSARGTRVTDKVRELVERPAREDADQFVARVVEEARTHGLDAAELAARIASDPRHRHDGPTVAVVECSAWQCEAHAAEIAARWRVDARPWPLTQDASPDADSIVATYFHYNDIRRRWPELLERVRFLTIRVAPELGEWLRGAASAIVVERDLPTAEAVAADVRTSVKSDLDLKLVVTEEPAEAIPGDADARVLFSPRVWSDLTEEVRSDSRCTVVRYELDDAELTAAARERGWAQLSN